MVNAERSATLLASVPPDVSTTSRGSTCASVARASRASSTTARAPRPNACTLDGFAHVSLAAADIASMTASSGGEVAFQSR